MPNKTLIEMAPPPREVSEGKQHNIFLSYRSVNRPWVINLYDVLRSLSHKVFLDQTHLVAGSSLHDELQSALRASQAGVLVWSKAASESDWVNSEYKAMAAIKRRDPSFNLVLVRLDDAEMPLFEEDNIFLDFASYPDGPNGGELLRLLHAVVGESLSDGAAHFAMELDEATRQAELEIETAVDLGDCDDLLSLAESSGLAWEVTPTLGAKTGEALSKLGHPDAAVDLLAKLVQSFPKAIRPQQMLAHALTRRGQDGDMKEAQKILGVLYRQGERDAETLGLYGRTFMDRYNDSGEALMLRKSRDLYAEGFDNASDDFYTGINAAAKSLMLATDEDRETARNLSLRVEEIVGTEVKPNMDYWDAATVAEVQLIAGNFEVAGKLYAAAVAGSPTEVGSHGSTFKQAKNLLDAHNAPVEDREQIERAFSHL